VLPQKRRQFFAVLRAEERDAGLQLQIGSLLFEAIAFRSVTRDS
jgi:hypothetical protein